MPIQHYPPRLIIEMVFPSIFWLNAFPHQLGVSQTLSPRTMVTGLHINYTKHCRVAFNMSLPDSVGKPTPTAPGKQPSGLVL
jgi:hypothetical protein